jgi:hypothetical protein
MSEKEPTGNESGLETTPSRRAMSYISEVMERSTIAHLVGLLALLTLLLALVMLASFALWAFLTYIPFWLILIMLVAAGIYGFFSITNQAAGSILRTVGESISNLFKKD